MTVLFVTWVVVSVLFVNLIRLVAAVRLLDADTGWSGKASTVTLVYVS